MNDDNCLHFDEISRFYPIEFQTLFKRYQSKNTKKLANLSTASIRPLLQQSNMNDGSAAS
jgi:hypothetical protein